MGESNTNPFRSVALVLISLTIIVLGVVYEQATSSSEAAQTSPVIKSTGMTTGSQSSTGTTTKTLPVAPTPKPSTTTNQPNLSTPSITLPTIPNQPTYPITNTPSTLTPTNWTLLTTTLQTIEQLVKTPLTFAYRMPEIKLPNVTLAFATTEPISPDTSTTVITPAPSINSNLSTPQKPQDNEVVATLKTITGIYKFQQFQEKFKDAQSKYAGTGQCMIVIGSSGCLMQW